MKKGRVASLESLSIHLKICLVLPLEPWLKPLKVTTKENLIEAFDAEEEITFMAHYSHDLVI